MRSTFRLPLIFRLGGLALVIGCASLSSIVKKPEIQQVKRVAIVSVTAPQNVPHKGGKGQVSGWNEANRLAIADQALAAYAAEFKKLGWDVIPTPQLSTLAIYKENFAPRISKAENGIAKALNSVVAFDADKMYFSPTGLYPVVWQDDAKQEGTLRLDLANLSLEKNKSLKTKMQEVAAQAGADAAILVQADFCYEDGSFWVGHAGSGTGTAVLTGASAIYGVTPKGIEVIKMKRIVAPCGGDRVVSDSSTAMLKGQLLFSNEHVQQMFQEVTRKAASENVKMIEKAMR